MIKGGGLLPWGMVLVPVLWAAGGGIRGHSVISGSGPDRFVKCSGLRHVLVC